MGVRSHGSDHHPAEGSETTPTIAGESIEQSPESGSADVKYRTVSVQVAPEDGAAEARARVGAETIDFSFSVEDGEWKIQSPPPFFL